MTRRKFLKDAAGWLAIGSSALVAPRWLWAADLPAGTIAASLLEKLPGKQPLIKRSYRPINYETPVEYFNDVITSNDRFFVRWHTLNLPDIRPSEWRLQIAGDAAGTPYELTLDQLKREFEQFELTAVCQCAGNRRGLSEPHVPGVQWGNGAMGNARWKGVRLKDVIARAGFSDSAIEVAFNGADTPIYDKTPDFIKSIPIHKALDENTLIAYEMNGAPLPHLNGGPARIVVPGWTATYWVKKVISIHVVSQPAQSFWMAPAYRVPKDMFPGCERFTSQEKEHENTTPVTEMVVNSLITNIQPGQRIPHDHQTIVRGIAWDAGHGIRQVEVSMDGGNTWQDAELGQDHGRYSFRQWQFSFMPAQPGKFGVMSRATNLLDETQPAKLVFNPAGYHNNTLRSIDVEAV